MVPLFRLRLMGALGYHHVDDNRRAKYGGNGADAKLGGRKDRAGDKVAKQAEYRAA